MEDWRRMDDDAKDEFRRWADGNLRERWTLGDKRYNSSAFGFQGDPLDHAIEEAFDLLLYLWMQKRKEDE